MKKKNMFLHLATLLIVFASMFTFTNCSKEVEEVIIIPEEQGASSLNLIITFSFDGITVVNVEVVVADRKVNITVPYGTNVTALKPVFTISAKATVTPESGTVLDFTNPVTYTVTAEDKTTAVWTVTVTVAPHDQ